MTNNNKTLSLLIRKPETLELFQLSKSTLHLRINEGLIPPQVKIGDRAVAFVRDEIVAVINAHIAGRSKDEIKILVKSLVEQRQTIFMEGV